MTATRRPGAASSGLSFRQELADCWYFLWHPTLRRLGRSAPVHDGLLRDWLPGIGFGRLMAWAGVLWAVNLFVLGPIAVAAAGAGGVSHRLDPDNIPWLTAVLWAPLAEEMLFRYGLRRPLQALWVCPVMLPVVMFGPMGWTGALLACVLLVACLPLRGRPGRTVRFASWRRKYTGRYGLVFHMVAVAFAVSHLNNFTMSHPSSALLPLLVLPQWVTGLVLGWMRTRRGIGASVALHAVFNAGPVLVIWVLTGLLPAAAR